MLDHSFLSDNVLLNMISNNNDLIETIENENEFFNNLYNVIKEQNNIKENTITNIGNKQSENKFNQLF